MTTSRIDILHVIGSFVAAGAERVIVDLALALKAAGHTVGVAALSAKIDDVGLTMRANLDAAGVVSVAGSTEAVRLRSALWYARELTRMQPRVVHLHTPNTVLAHYLGRLRRRQPHGLFLTLHNTNVPDSLRYLHAIRRDPVQACIACSSAAKDAMAPKVSGPIEVVLNSIRFDWPVRDAATHAERAAKLGLADDLRYFLSVGRVSGSDPATAAKANHVLIRAWRESEVGASAGGVLHLLGDGELRSALVTLASGDPSIVFRGDCSGIHYWLLGGGSFMMASRHEGLPIVGIEALATGLPCIFSRIPPLRELGAARVRWVEVNDVAGLGPQLRARAAGPREYLKEAAIGTRETYSTERVARRYLQCYADHGTTFISDEAA